MYFRNYQAEQQESANESIIPRGAKIPVDANGPIEKADWVNPTVLEYIKNNQSDLGYLEMTYRVLEDELNIKRCFVISAIKELEENGSIRVIRRDLPYGIKLTNRYVFLKEAAK